MTIRRCLVPVLLLSGLGAPATPQLGSGRHFTRYTGPMRSASVDLATGTVRRGPVASNRAGQTVVDFFNLDTGGFTGVDSGGGFCEWFDAGVKGSKRGDGTAFVDSGNTSDLMNSVVFAYCSSAMGVGSGGPGGSVKLGFYEGYTTGGTSPTTSVLALTLTGLPANSGSGGGFTCYFLRLAFGTLISFADGPIGYSWRFLDRAPGSALAATWPYLACVASCSGTLATVDGQGMDGFIDQYCPPGFLRSTFTFGTTSGSFTGLSMVIEEVVPVDPTPTAANSSTNPNPDILTTTPAVVGQSFGASITLGLGRTSGAFNWILYTGSSSIQPPAGVAIPRFQGGLDFGTNKRGRMLLCNLQTNGFSCAGTHSGVSGTTSLTACNTTVPRLLTLVANDWCAQAVVLGRVAPGSDGGGGARLSSMVFGTIGTP